MTDVTTCPEREELKDLLDGTLPDDRQADLQDHLETCLCCQATLEGLAAGKDTWCGMAEKLPRGEIPPEEGLRRVLEEFRQRGPEEETAEHPGDDERLAFLSPPRDPAHIGRIGPYDVVEVIGRGGMGLVLKAFDPALHRVVAIKVLAPQLATTAAARKRFEREGRAAAAISHEHVVAIHAVEEANGLPYLVMEYVPGVSLQEKLDCAGPLELKELLRIGMQTARGLAAAHAQGLVHRDIKPANILLYNGVERVKITDFGLARAVDDASVTQSGFVAGTPQYMAPEQARGEAVDHRADLFSLGSVLYALCTGRPPFRASTTLAVLKRVAEERARPIREINADIPVWLVEIIERLHAKQPADRFASAAEVAEVLGQRLAELQQAQPACLPLYPLPSSARPSRVRAWAIAAAVLFGASLLMAQVIIRIKSKDGKETTEIRVPEGHTIEIVPATGNTPPPDVVPRFTPPPGVRGSQSVPGAMNPFPGGRDLLLDGAVIRPGSASLSRLAEEQFHRLDRNRNGLLSNDEMPASLRAERDRWDANKDGFIDLNEYKQYFRQRVGVLLADRNQRGGQQLASFGGFTGRVHAVAISPDNRILVGAAGEPGNQAGEIKLWDLATRKELSTVKQPSAVLAAAFSPGSTTLATGEADHTVRLWGADSGRLETILRGHTDAVNSVAFAPDGQTLASGSTDGTVKIWRLGSRELLETLDCRAIGSVFSVAFSPDGKTLAVAGGRLGVAGEVPVKLFEVGSWAVRRTFVGHDGFAWSVAFSPDGKILAGANSGGTVVLWRVADGKVLDVLRHEEVGPPAFSPDGKLLATACANGLVRVWQLTTREEAIRSGGPGLGGKTQWIGVRVTAKPVADLPGHTARVLAVAFSSGGQILASAGMDRTIKLWAVPTLGPAAEPLREKASGSDKALRERLAALQGILAQKEKQFKLGTVPGKDLIRAQLRVLQAELPLCTTAAEQVAVHEKIVASLRDLEKQMEQLHKAGVIPESDFLEVRAARAEAEAALEEAKHQADQKPTR